MPKLKIGKTESGQLVAYDPSDPISAYGVTPMKKEGGKLVKAGEPKYAAVTTPEGVVTVYEPEEGGKATILTEDAPTEATVEIKEEPIEPKEEKLPEEEFLESVGIAYHIPRPAEELELKYKELEPIRPALETWARFGAGGAAGIITLPRGMYELGTGLATKPVETVKETVLGIKRGFEIDPAYTAGGLASQFLVFKGATKISPKISYAKIKIPTKKGVEIVRTIGVEKGTRAFTFVSKTSEGFRFGVPKMKKPLKLSEPMITPETALRTKVLKSVLDLEKTQIVRLKETVKIAKIGRGEKGLRVKPGKLLFPVEGLKYPKKTSLMVESWIAKRRGVIFGSAAQQIVPKGFRKRVIGDIDVVLPKVETKILGEIRVLSKRLRKAGEDVRVSRRNPLIIEFRKTGKKLLEFKAAYGGKYTSAGGVAESGFAGIPFTDLRAGLVGKTLKYGKTRAIYAGEQLGRKGAAVSFFLPKKGKIQMLPIPRRAKDLPTFILQVKAVKKLKEMSIRPSKKIAAKKMDIALEKYLETFPKAERAKILKEVEALKGKKKVRISIGKPSKEVKIKPSRPSPYVSPKAKPSVSPKVSPSISPKVSPYISPKVSPYPSPKPSPSPYISPKPSPSISPKVSPYPSISPKVSPSPYISPYPSPTPITKISPVPTLAKVFPDKPTKLIKKRKVKKGKRLVKYKPSIVGIFEKKIKWKSPKISMGAEVRPTKRRRK